MKKIFILLSLLALASLLVGCNNESAEPDNRAAVEIRNMDVKLEENQVYLTAEAKVINSKLFYRIEQGDVVLHKEKQIDLDTTTEWNKIKMEETLPEEAFDKDDFPVVVIYSKDDKGEVVNPNYIPVDADSN